jgi:tRNA threonylcarbamoyladenosine biosynthesis protein TsaB
LRTGDALLRPEARINAEALAALAGRAWQAGAGVDPAAALPLYVRDKVAETTRERAAKR